MIIGIFVHFMEITTYVYFPTCLKVMYTCEGVQQPIAGTYTWFC